MLQGSRQADDFFVRCVIQAIYYSTILVELQSSKSSSDTIERSLASCRRYAVARHLRRAQAAWPPFWHDAAAEVSAESARRSRHPREGHRRHARSACLMPAPSPPTCTSPAAGRSQDLDMLARSCCLAGSHPGPVQMTVPARLKQYVLLFEAPKAWTTLNWSLKQDAMAARPALMWSR